MKSAVTLWDKWNKIYGMETMTQKIIDPYLEQCNDRVGDEHENLIYFSGKQILIPRD